MEEPRVMRFDEPVRFDEFMEMALYDPAGGFFAAVGEAGAARGDFITSPEIGPLFGLLVSRFLDQQWIGAGRPERFDVVEFAAGRGALAIAVRAARPECSAALRYHMVERSERLRERQGEHLEVVDPSDESAAPLLSRPDPAAGASVTHPGGGPIFYCHATEADLPGTVNVVFANELLDNIPFRLFEMADGWHEVWVRKPGSTNGPPDAWTERLVPSEPAESELLESLAPAAATGARVPLQAQAGEWLGTALSLAATGTVVVIDYCRASAEMAGIDQVDWLRTYRSHGRGGSPLDAPGTQDITCDVAVDQLAVIRQPTQNLSQSEWFEDLGIEELVEEGRREWQAKAASPDVAAMRARSRVREAEALCDPTGLGAFRVLTWSPESARE